MTSLNEKGAFSENHPLSAGTANGFSLSDTVIHFLQNANLFFSIGPLENAAASEALMSALRWS